MNFCGKVLQRVFFAEAVMRKRNELERMKMMRKEEERRREELVRLLWKMENKNKKRNMKRKQIS